MENSRAHAGAEQEQNIRGGQIKNLQLLLLKS